MVQANVETLIHVSHLSYQYPKNDQIKNHPKALDDVSFDIKKGEFVGVIGHNGSGKSTLAKLLNGIMMPTEGDVVIAGMNTKDEGHLWDIRRMAGMVFQNPDNQLVSTIVEEDVAFGPENLGIDPSEIRLRVDQALEQVSMSAYKDHHLHQLSGGQKQRIAIAGILAMAPECMIFDEATAMLDPVGRRDVMQIIHRLNREKSLTILHITHDMTELVDADKIIVLHEGKIVMSGSPEEIFKEVEKLKVLHLDVPPMTELAYRLRKKGMMIPEGVMTAEKMAEALGC